MIKFKNIEIADKAWMEPLILAGGMRGCEHGFTTAFIWDKAYHYFVTKVNDFLLVQVGKYFFYPSGTGDIKPVIETMMSHAAEIGSEFYIVGVTPDKQEELDRLFPDKFKYSDERNSYDYLYLVKSLSSLAGHKLQAKRNHINRFIENNPDWKFEPITDANIEECKQMSKAWFEQAVANHEESIKVEIIAIEACFSHYKELALDGGLIRAGGKVIAFTIGDQLSSDTFDIHIEKAFGNIQGAYPIINREFARYIASKYPNIIYFNREDDLGSQGIRKSKLSYRPEILLEKRTCELKV